MLSHYKNSQRYMFLGGLYVDHQQISLVNNGWWIEIFSSLQNNPVFLYGWQQVECGRHRFKVRQVAQK